MCCVQRSLDCSPDQHCPTGKIGDTVSADCGKSNGNQQQKCSLYRNVPCTLSRQHKVLGGATIIQNPVKFVKQLPTGQVRGSGGRSHEEYSLDTWCEQKAPGTLRWQLDWFRDAIHDVIQTVRGGKLNPTGHSARCNTVRLIRRECRFSCLLPMCGLRNR